VDDRVVEWLEGLGLGQLAERFAAAEIDYEILPQLTEDDLRELELPLGPRRKLLTALEALRAGTAAPAPAEPAAETAAAPGSRRQVTVLFADIAGYTRLSSGLDAEETHALLNRFFAAVDAVVRGYGGAIDKHIGDAVMAVFGAPVAHTDDPLRAARAALDIHAAVARLEPPLQVHVGLASGQVVASSTGSAAHTEYTVTGDSVNLASRLTDLAETGETLAAASVQRALGLRFLGDNLGERKFQGLLEPISVWRLRGLADESAPVTGSFVGRARELKQFDSVLEDCLATGRGATLVIRGEPGIGKTRLLDEFVRRAGERGVETHTGLVLDFGAGKGQDAIRSLVRSLLDLPPGADKTVRAVAAARAIDAGLLAEEQRVHLNDLLDLEQPLELRALYDAMDNQTRNDGKREMVAALVRARSRQAPLLPRLEDLHWADKLTLQHATRLAETVAECPALLVMTTRVQGDPFGAGWRGALADGPVTTMDLGPLRADEALNLAREFDGVSKALVDACVARAGGNPLFLEQLLRNVDELADGEIPGTVQGIVQARLDALPAGDRAAIQAAAVLGQRFALSAVRSLMEDDGYEPAVLLQAALIRPAGEDYHFAHALIRDGAYASLLRGDRERLHRRAAAWFREVDLTLHAEHLDQAGDAGAAMAYLDAARGERAKYRFEVAERLALRGLELAGDDAARFELTCFHAELQRLLGQPAASIASFDAALAIAPDDAGRCRAWIGIGAASRLTGDYDRGMAVLGEAAGTAAALGLEEALAQIHYYRGAFEFARGDAEGCLQLHREAFEHATAAEAPEWQARALSGIGDGLYALGRMRSARVEFGRCVELTEQHGLGEITVANLYMLANTARYMNEFADALAIMARAVEAAVQVGNRRAEQLARLLYGELLTDHGDFEAAVGPLQAAYEIADSLNNDRLRAYIRNHQARLRLLMGETDEAAALLEEGLALNAKIPANFIGPRLHGNAALAAASTDRRRDLLAAGEAIVEAGCISHNWLFFYRDAIEASLMNEDWDEAERYAAELELRTESEPLPWSDFFIARGRALAAFGRGARDAATLGELQRLRHEAADIGLRVPLPMLDAALAAAG